ncbi:MAG: hypothetical protein ACK5MR_15940, partial [Cumulibacter sp.]
NTALVSMQRTYYDGATSVTSAPSKGNPTTISTSATLDSGAVTFADTTMTYDTYGRVTSTSDPLDRTTSTAYTDTSGQTTAMTVTNAKGQESTTHLSAARGVVSAEVGVAGQRTDVESDALGRTSKVWLPGRAKASNPTPSIAYAYAITAGKPPSVKTTTLTPSGGTTSSFEIYDGLLNLRQTQEPSEGGGRVVNETVLDAAGRPINSIGPYYALGDPSGLLFVPGTAVPAEIVSTYDGAGRTVKQTQKVNNTAKWSTSYSYDGKSVKTTPPNGAPATRKVQDARGNPTALWTYHGNAPTGAYDDVTYTHTPAGQLASMTDAAGNEWTWDYDLAGNEVSVDDPDSGLSTSMFDLAGQRTSTTDSRGQTITTTYDDLGRVTGTYDGASVTAAAQLSEQTYDSVMVGMPATSTRFDQSGDYVQSIGGYTAAGLPTSSSITIPESDLAGDLAGTYTTAYTYTVNNQIKTVKHPALGGLPTETVTTSYTNLGRPKGLLRSAYAYVNQVTYTHLNEVTQMSQTALNTANYHSFYYQDGTRRLARTYVTTRSQTLADRNDEMQTVAVNNDRSQYQLVLESRIKHLLLDRHEKTERCSASSSPIPTSSKCCWGTWAIPTTSTGDESDRFGNLL